MTHEDYINKTREPVNFLMHIFSEKMEFVSTIVVAQANHNTERFIDLLGLVKGRCEDWIEELKTMEQSAMTNEEYLNSKIEAYGKSHPNGNKEDLALLAEMRGYDMEE